MSLLPGCAIVPDIVKVINLQEVRISMNFWDERIVKDGIVKPGSVLKVDSF